MNSSKVQNPQRKLDDKCLCLSIICVRFCSCLCKVCSRVSEALLLALQTLSLTNNSSSDSKAFLCFIAFSGFPTPVHRPHYGITLWAYLSEPLVKDSHKRLSLTEKPQYHVLKSLDHTLCYGEVCSMPKTTQRLGKEEMNITALV